MKVGDTVRCLDGTGRIMFIDDHIYEVHVMLRTDTYSWVIRKYLRWYVDRVETFLWRENAPFLAR